MEAKYDVSMMTVQPDLVADEARALIQRAVRTVLEQEGTPACEVSVYLTDDEEIRALNASYRGKDAPTDVLSFAFEDATHEDKQEAWLPGDMPLLLGDIVISIERAKAQAQDYGHKFERELAFLAVHGTLHLLGYDHETTDERQVMRGREEAALKGLGLPR